MQHHLGNKKSALVLGGIIVLAVLGYGGYRFWILAKEHRAQQVAIADLRKTITDLQGNLSLTEYERDHLTNVLSETQAHAGELEAQKSELVGTVDTLQKLTTIDPELLKKYSRVYFLNEHYTPSSLADIPTEYLSNPARKFQFHGQAIGHLTAMLDAATDSGLGLRIGSAYRSYGTQEALKSSYKVTYGTTAANKFSADQGYSEHQLGTAVDLTTAKTGTLTTAFEKTPEWKWLTEHAREYGFVLSYPKNNKYYIYEPWHWRYVGVSLATWLHDNGKYLYDVDQREIDEYLLTIFD